jgi:hypothetical protein
MPAARAPSTNSSLSSMKTHRAGADPSFPAAIS